MISIILSIIFSVSVPAEQDTEIIKAVETLKQAIISGKRDDLEKITHENLTYGHSSGYVEDKKAFVEALASGKSDFTSMNLTDQVIKITGDVATVRHKLAAELMDGGKTTSLNLSVLLVFVKEKGEWKLLARQAVKITS